MLQEGFLGAFGFWWCAFIAGVLKEEEKLTKAFSLSAQENLRFKFPCLGFSCMCALSGVFGVCVFFCLIHEVVTGHTSSSSRR